MSIGRPAETPEARTFGRAGLRSGPTAMLAAIGLITIVRLVWLAVQPADLYPDEAQYWFWAQHLSFGYYSKPPLVAWLIALTTGLFGNGEFAVRLSAPLLHAGTACFVYGIGARLYDRRIGFWSALAYASLPGVSISAFIISTDAPLLLCWSAALYAFIRAREEEQARWWVMVGLAVGFGLLAKYAMVYWVLSSLALLLLERAERRHWCRLFPALGLAFLLYLPNLWWNWANGFVSYLHTESNADLTRSLFHPAQLAAFFGSQFGVFGPIFFAVLIVIVAVPARMVAPRVRLLAVFALPTLALMLVLSLLSRAHANWAAPTYVSATVLVVGWLLERDRRRLIMLAIALNLFAAVSLFGARQATAALGISLPAKYDPLHRLRGWRALGHAVEGVLARHPGDMLLVDDREVLAALIYYVRPHPFTAAAWSLTPRISNQWDLTNPLSQYQGKNFVLVSVHHLIGEMRPSFASIEPLGRLIVPIGPGRVRRYMLYLARDFKGYRRHRAVRR